MRKGIMITPLFCLAGLAVAGPDFRSVGVLAGGNGAGAQAVSGDGNWVVGLSVSTSGLQAFRWSLPGGIQGLGDFPQGQFSSSAYAVSRNGRVVVGSGTLDGYQQAFRWTAETGLVGLGDLNPDDPLASSVAYGVSGDGAKVVGTSDAPDGLAAFLWTEPSGLIDLGGFPGDVAFVSSEGAGISLDGHYVVGNGDSGFTQMAFRWNGSGPIEPLYTLPDGFFSIGTSCSGDGARVVGYGDDGIDIRAFLWENGTMAALPPLDVNFPESYANAISADGTTIVGRAVTGTGEQAFVWTAAGGTKNLKTVLQTTYGLNLTGWTLQTANGVSEDGTVIVGTGTQGGQTRGWVARLPKAGTVEASVTLGDLPNSEGEPVVVELRAPGSSTPVETRTIAIDSIGMIRFVTSLRGSYDLAIKGSNWLRSVHSIVVTNVSVTAAPFSLNNGDVTNDNAVDIGDYSNLSIAYGSFDGDPNWNPAADLNRDGAVDVGDYAILSSNYGLFGDD